MALERKKRLDWSDIQSIYNSLNQARDKFSMNRVTVPEETRKKAVPSNVSDLKDEITSMVTNSYIQAAGITTNNIQVPERKTLIYPSPFVAMKNTIDQILDVCPHNGTYHASGFYSSNGGGGEDFGCNIFHSDTCDSHGGQTPGWCDTNHGSYNPRGNSF